MKIYSLLLFDNNNNIISKAFELTSFSYFQRNSIKEFIVFFCNMIINNIDYNQNNRIEHNEFVIYCLKTVNNFCCLICNNEYPSQPAYLTLYNIIHKQSTTNELEKLIIKIQDPLETNKIFKIQNNLNETKEILYNTIDSLLERGEKLENLVEKSNILSSQSKMFYSVAKKHNSCCYIS